MERQIYLVNIIAIYWDLFTKKQQVCFEDYYFNNLTLSEMSENYGITRNAIHKRLKETEEKLLFYENTLRIYEKNKKILALIQDKALKEKIEEIL